MFDSIVSTSFYGSPTPYVRGKMVRIDDTTVAFDLETKDLSQEEKEALTEFIKDAEEFKEKIMSEMSGLVAITNKVVIDCNDERLRFIIKGIKTGYEERIAQANPRMGGIVHFQFKENLDDETYDKADIKIDELAVILFRILLLNKKTKTETIEAEAKETEAYIQ